MEKLAEAKAGFRSLTETIDTTTAAGRMMMHMVSSFVEYERAMLRERTKGWIVSWLVTWPCQHRTTVYWRLKFERENWLLN